MTQKNYDHFKRLSEAQNLTNEWTWYHSTMIDDTGIIDVQKDGHHAFYHPEGLVSVFSSGGSYGSPPIHIPAWPDGIQLQVYTGPYKEYAVVTGQDGVTRYYVLPQYNYDSSKDSVKERLRRAVTMMPHPEKLYVPVHPLPDYHISISRKQKNDAFIKWKNFLEFRDTMWELLPKDPPTAVRQDVSDKLSQTTLKHDDRSSWHCHVQHARMNHQTKEDLRRKVEELIIRHDMPYNIKLTPVIKPSHTRHWDWDTIRKLGMRGRLDDLEMLEDE